MNVDEWTVMWARGYVDGFGDVLTTVREMIETDHLYLPAAIIDELHIDRAKLPPTGDDPQTLRQERDHGYAEGFEAAFRHVKTLANGAEDVMDVVPQLEKLWDDLVVPECEPFDPAEFWAERPAEKITGPEDIVTVVASLLRGRTRERSVVVACNHRNQVLGCDIICEGTANRSLMSPREAVVAVLRRDGLAFAVAHNHPSGDPTPSREDIAATVVMRQAANAVGMRFLDHVIVTDTSWRSVMPYAHGLRRVPTKDAAAKPSADLPPGTERSITKQAGP